MTRRCLHYRILSGPALEALALKETREALLITKSAVDTCIRRFRTQQTSLRPARLLLDETNTGWEVADLLTTTNS